MIILNDDLLIGSGRERSCYRHPKYPERCIKVVQSFSSRTKTRIKREIKYIQKYKRSPQPLEVIPSYYGRVHTNLGMGYQFELILDHDMRIAKKLSLHLQEDGMSEKIHEYLLHTYRLFLNANAVVSDLHADNLLLQKKSNIEERLVMVDGFGNSDLIAICDYSKFFCRKKLIRKFTRMFESLGLSTSGIR